MNIIFSKKAWSDFEWFKKQNLAEYKKIKELIGDIQKNKFEGLGKPEPLKNELAGYWSRRITREHRLVYTIENKTINIIACRFHYE